MKKYIYLLLLAGSLTACNHANPAKDHAQMLADAEALKSALIQTDRSFSQMSNDNGRSAAFAQYAADDAVLLKPFSAPVPGRDSILASFASTPDSLYKMRWTPLKADVGTGGDIGYTYGTYTLYVWGIGLGKEHGTYCTVWKKEDGHNWKFVLITRNNGLNPDDRESYHEMNTAFRKEAKKE